MGRAGGKEEGWVVKEVVEMGVGGGEDVPGKNGVAFVRVSGYMRPKVIAEMGFTLQRPRVDKIGKNER